jgi:hypothetical protein
LGLGRENSESTRSPEHAQKVRGIIIAKEVGDALHYAVRDIPDLSVLTYKVDFRLAPAKK